MRLLQSFSRAVLLVGAAAASLQAQCYDSNTGITVGTGDDIVLAGQTLPFAFPFNGATYTTVHPSTNGFVYLGNGTASTLANCCSGNVTALTTSSSPMLAPWWTDLNMIAGTGAVKFNASPAAAVVTWENAVEYGNSVPFSVQLQLLPTGEFDFIWDARVAIRSSKTFLVGMSPGAGATAGAQTNFAVVGTSATNTNHQIFGPANGAVSVSGKGVHFVPTNPGFVWVPTNCSASHTSYGAGCYSAPGGLFYELFNDAVAANAGLQGNALLLTPAGGNYVPSWLPGTATALYLPPSAAAVAMATSDDGDTPVALPLPLTLPSGAANNLVVSHNGIITVTTATVGNNYFDYTPSGAEMAAALGLAFYPGWHDWNDGDTVGTGRIKTELVGGTFCITWDNVENYPVGVANPGTMQVQFQLATGVVTYVWTAIDPSTASTFGTSYLVGFKADGALADPGSISLATALPPTVGFTLFPLSLSATPNPVSTPTAGTTVTYTTNNIPEFAPGSGIRLAVNILSLGSVPAPGLDLGFLGAPGCVALVQSTDFTQSMVGASALQSVTFAIPAGVPTGFQIYAQSAALTLPNSLPNGQNAFGLITSNGIASFVAAQ